MLCKNSKDVIKIVKERNVSFIQFWFTDVLGILKSFSITPSELEEALSELDRVRQVVRQTSGDWIYCDVVQTQDKQDQGRDDDGQSHRQPVKAGSDA